MDWPDVARAQAGVITRAQLRASGVSSSAIGRMQGSRAILAQCRNVFIVRGAPTSYRAQLWTSVLAVDGVLGCGTATYLSGCVGRPEQIDVMVSEGRRVAAPPDSRLHRTLLAATPVHFRDGLPMAGRAWALLDHLGELSYPRALRLADRALQRSWLTRADIEQRLRDHPYRYGNSVLRQLLDQTADGAAATSERRLHAVLEDAGLVGWVANFPLWHRGELVAVLDVAFPHQRLAIEVDGMAYHVDGDRFQRDRHRQNAVVALGWTVLRFTWADIIHRPRYVASAVRGAAA